MRESTESIDINTGKIVPPISQRKPGVYCMCANRSDGAQTVSVEQWVLRMWCTHMYPIYWILLDKFVMRKYIISYEIWKEKQSS